MTPMSPVATSAAGKVQEVSDRELVARLVANDATALRVLFARHQVRVFRLILRFVRNEAVAEELTNEVFLETWRNAGTFEGRASLVSWVLSIARNKAVSSLRRRREAQLDAAAQAEVADESDTPEDTAQKSGTSTLLRRCIDQLSAEHREIIDLVYYHEMSIREVSEIIGIPENTVKTRMFYARKRLSELLRAAGVDRGWP